jgi:hypothetical protein
MAHAVDRNFNNPQRERETEMFGCRESELLSFIDKHVGKGKPFAGLQQAALSLLSDAQEEMFVNIERARKTINRAKWLIDRARG